MPLWSFQFKTLTCLYRQRSAKVRFADCEWRTLSPETPLPRPFQAATGRFCAEAQGAGSSRLSGPFSIRCPNSDVADRILSLHQPQPWNSKILHSLPPSHRPHRRRCCPCIRQLLKGHIRSLVLILLCTNLPRSSYFFVPRSTRLSRNLDNRQLNPEITAPPVLPPEFFFLFYLFICLFLFFFQKTSIHVYNCPIPESATSLRVRSPSRRICCPCSTAEQSRPTASIAILLPHYSLCSTSSQSHGYQVPPRQIASKI